MKAIELCSCGARLELDGPEHDVTSQLNKFRTAHAECLAIGRAPQLRGRSSVHIKLANLLATHADRRALVVAADQDRLFDIFKDLEQLLSGAASVCPSPGIVRRTHRPEVIELQNGSQVRGINTSLPMDKQLRGLAANLIIFDEEVHLSGELEELMRPVLNDCHLIAKTEHQLTDKGGLEQLFGEPRR